MAAMRMMGEPVPVMDLNERGSSRGTAEVIQWD